MGPVCTIMGGRLDDWLKVVAEKQDITLDPGYLEWAVACFRLSTSSVRDETSIHTHMCYSEFNDIMAAIAAMDADAISIETTRSRMELLDAFGPGQGGGGRGYPAEIGPGVWDIHSPRVPDTAEMLSLLQLARARLQEQHVLQ